MNQANISPILEWFQAAVQEPTDKSRSIQIGCHIEEYSEMMVAVCGMGGVWNKAQADHYKKRNTVGINEVDRKELLDSLCDQIVTAVGIAHMFGFDIQGALNEVNRSNFSKFVDGKPVFDENGKIAKPPSYSPPDLSAFLQVAK